MEFSALPACLATIRFATWNFGRLDVVTSLWLNKVRKAIFCPKYFTFLKALRRVIGICDSCPMEEDQIQLKGVIAALTLWLVVSIWVVTNI